MGHWNNVVRFFRGNARSAKKYPHMTLWDLKRALERRHIVIVKVWVRKWRHFVVVWGMTDRFVRVADSLDDRRRISQQEFLRNWDRWGAEIW